MLLVLKAIHILSLAIGIGGSVAAAIVGARSAKSQAEVSHALGLIQKLLGRIVFAAIILLWITGIWMLSLAYGWQVKPLGQIFSWKMAAVVVLTIIATTSQILVLRATSKKQRPNPKVMKRLGQAGLLLAMLAAILAVYTFN